MPYFKRDPILVDVLAPAPRRPAAQPSPPSPLELVERSSALLNSERNVEGAQPGRPLPLLELGPGAIRASSVARGLFRVANDEAQSVDTTFYATDLLSDQGRIIPRSALSFDPVVLSVPGRRMLPVEIVLVVPPETAPGNYSGVIRAAGLPDTQAVLSVEVT